MPLGSSRAQSLFLFVSKVRAFVVEEDNWMRGRMMLPQDDCFSTSYDLMFTKTDAPKLYPTHWL